jgi:hypothetical protein
MQGAQISTPPAFCKVTSFFLPNLSYLTGSRRSGLSLSNDVAETVKVPQMAESITEGTLKSWSKQVGDSVAADEEVATIETDKVRSRSSMFIGPRDLQCFLHVKPIYFPAGRVM